MDRLNGRTKGGKRCIGKGTEITDSTEQNLS
jgi:hypothetical protein